MKRCLSLLLALCLAALCACAPAAPAESGTAGQPAPPESAAGPADSEPPPDGPRPVTQPSQLLGEPDRFLLAARGKESVLDKDAPEAQALLDTLAQRFPEKLKIAAAAFEWDREDGQGVDWSRMAEDFEYIRLSYDQEQAVSVRCLATPEGLPEWEEEYAFTDIVFPLTGGQVETCIAGKETFGVLEHSEETLDKLRGFFPRPAPSLEAAAPWSHTPGDAISCVPKNLATRYIV